MTIGIHVDRSDGDGLQALDPFFHEIAKSPPTDPL
jgi:hypothetical protein